jgi:DNA polymerase-3 subunit alpha
VLAKNAQGFSSICASLSAAVELSRGNKRRNAACPLDAALDVLHDVVILSGCFSSPFWRPGGDVDLAKWVDKFGDDFFFEVQPLDDWSEQIKLNIVVAAAASRFKRPIVVTPDCHFATADDGKLHDALLAFANREKVGAEGAWRFSTRLNYLMTPEEVGRRLARAGFTTEQAVQAVLNTDRVSERISEWSFDELPRHQIPTVDGDFNEMTRAAFQRRDFANVAVYQERLDEELKVFTEAGLANYFLLVVECLRLFREDGVMIGPRGSIAGCLVAYVLGISNVDPVRHDLPYWRFWYPGRSLTGKGGSPPDADIDLPVAYHPRVVERLRGRFGKDRVAKISTVGTFGIRLAVRSAARTFGVFMPEHEEFSGEIAQPEAYWLWHELPLAAREFAQRLIGRVEKYGIHPGGVVISTDRLTDGRSAIVRRGKEDALCWDMESAEKLGFLKIDFLGNASMDALGVLSDVLDVKDVEAIPLDDPDVMKDFREGRTAGIPQFVTPGMRTFTEMIGPQEFKDLVWANAGFRKGAFGEGRGPREMATAYRENPNSVMVFQEDLMECCRTIAGLTWDETDKIRKIVSKSKGNVALAEWRSKFIDGCVKVALITRGDAEALWSSFESSGEYLFNRAHATSYGANAFRIAFLKRKDPVKAFTALLNIEKDSNRELLLDEAEERGVTVVPPDPNKSGFHWLADGSRILTPIQHADGADVRIAKAIVLRRTQREVKKGNGTALVGGLFKDQADFTARMGSPAKIPYKGKDGKTRFRAGILRPGWFDAKLWNPQISRTVAPKIPDKIESEAFREVVKECGQCALRATCRAPVPPQFGRTNVLVLGDSPGKYEDGRGVPFVGKSGVMLFNLLYNEGVDRKNLTVMYAVSCLPPKAEAADAIDCPWAAKYISHWKPPLILAVGRRAWQHVSGLGKAAPGITKMNATLYQRPDGIGVVPMIHPASILYDNGALMPELERAARKFAKLFLKTLRVQSVSTR